MDSTQPFDMNGYETFDTATAAHDAYATLSDFSWDLWDAATDAWLEGDTDAAFALTNASIQADMLSDESWDLWNDSFATTQDADLSSSGYDTSSWSAADTSSWSAAADTSSWSAAADTTSTSTWSAADTSSWSASAE